jgi:flavin reductase (DIM6/NTAB) family NADH-FMN oxidoreductase RutF
VSDFEDPQDSPMSDLLGDAHPTLDTKALRQGFGTFATGIGVITVRGAAGLMGLTVNSFTSVSLNPPLILWCLGKGSNRLSAYTQAEVFGVNILRADQRDLSDRFSRMNPYYAPDEEFVAADEHLKFSGSIGWLNCKAHQIHDAGDHVIIVGRVTGFDMYEGEGLTYFRGKYGKTE